MKRRAGDRRAEELSSPPPRRIEFLRLRVVSIGLMRRTQGLLLPSAEIFTDPDQLYIGIGILGATVMPHSLYLHSRCAS